MRLIAFATACLLLGPSAAARDVETEPAARPQVLARVFACRDIQVEAERLACYDREVTAFQAAEATRAIAVFDREQVRRTRRSLFGIVLPNLDIFGGGKDDKEEAEEFSQLETTIRGVSQDSQGRYLLTLADGARWAQIDNRDLSATPRPGQTIRIRRAAMGSYLANIGTQTAIRVRRFLPGN